jgi:hypothetical protein
MKQLAMLLILAVAGSACAHSLPGQGRLVRGAAHIRRRRRRWWRMKSPTDCIVPPLSSTPDRDMPLAAIRDDKRTEDPDFWTPVGLSYGILFGLLAWLMIVAGIEAPIADRSVFTGRARS